MQASFSVHALGGKASWHNCSTKGTKALASAALHRNFGEEVLVLRIIVSVSVLSRLSVLMWPSEL